MNVGEIVIEKPQTKQPLPPFYYVIFANGEDCDATGLEAAAANDFVMFDDRLYMPGENMLIFGRDLVFKRHACLDGPTNGRHIRIERCHLHRRF